MALNFKRELIGCFSIPCAKNPTVAMMETAFSQHGMNWRYINTEVQPEDLQAAVAGALAMGWRGFNLSIPHKVSIIDYLDGLGESASVIGAVNMVVRRGGKFIGKKTDGKGFLKLCRKSLIQKVSQSLYLALEVPRVPWLSNLLSQGQRISLLLIVALNAARFWLTY